MTFPNDPHERSPKGDHNRRLALGMELDELAEEAGITPQELRHYEFTPPDGEFELAVAQRVGEALERLEATREPKVDNGPKPVEDAIAGDEDDPPIARMGTTTYKAPNA
jgi:transcriptional regulator with XRE-family HTH domain